MKTEAENKNIFNSFEETAFYNALEKIKFMSETALWVARQYLQLYFLTEMVALNLICSKCDMVSKTS